MIRFLSNDLWSFLDRFLWYHLKCIVWVLSLFFWEASMLGHGAGIDYNWPRMGPIDNFSLVTGSPLDRYSYKKRRVVCVYTPRTNSYEWYARNLWVCAIRKMRCATWLVKSRIMPGLGQNVANHGRSISKLRYAFCKLRRLTNRVQHICTRHSDRRESD